MGDARLELPTILAGPTLMVPGKTILPDGLFAIETSPLHMQVHAAAGTLGFARWPPPGRLDVSGPSVSTRHDRFDMSPAERTRAMEEGR